MILWTIQPEEVFNLIQETGIYRCDSEKIDKDYVDFEQYNWMASQMRKRIGPPPEGVNYPVWAYQRWYGTRIRPDIRALVWQLSGTTRRKFYRIEVDIPDEKVLLSDYDAWNIILHNGLLADTKQEYEELMQIYESLSPEAQEEMRTKNWEKVFDMAHFENEWTRRGIVVQASFWELRKENIVKATMFTTAFRKISEKKKPKKKKPKKRKAKTRKAKTRKKKQ